jgi:hypothetical protein
MTGNPITPGQAHGGRSGSVGGSSVGGTSGGRVSSPGRGSGRAPRGGGGGGSANPHLPHWMP